MLCNNMADNYRNNQSVFNCKSNFKTSITIENYGEYFVMIVIHILKVLNLLLYEDIALIVLEFLQHVINVKLLKLLV